MVLISSHLQTLLLSQQQNLKWRSQASWLPILQIVQVNIYIIACKKSKCNSNRYTKQFIQKFFFLSVIPIDDQPRHAKVHVYSFNRKLDDKIEAHNVTQESALGFTDKATDSSTPSMDSKDTSTVHVVSEPLQNRKPQRYRGKSIKS